MANGRKLMSDLLGHIVSCHTVPSWVTAFLLVGDQGLKCICVCLELEGYLRGNGQW